MALLKKGDVVRCLRSSLSQPKLIKGNIYSLESDEVELNDCYRIIIPDLLSDFYYFTFVKDWFEPYVEEPAPRKMLEKGDVVVANRDSTPCCSIKKGERYTLTEDEDYSSTGMFFYIKKICGNKKYCCYIKDWFDIPKQEEKMKKLEDLKKGDKVVANSNLTTCCSITKGKEYIVDEDYDFSDSDLFIEKPECDGYCAFNKEYFDIPKESQVSDYDKAKQAFMGLYKDCIDDDNNSSDELESILADMAFLKDKGHYENLLNLIKMTAFSGVFNDYFEDVFDDQIVIMRLKKELKEAKDKLASK